MICIMIIKVELIYGFSQALFDFQFQTYQTIHIVYICYTITIYVLMFMVKESR